TRIRPRLHQEGPRVFRAPALQGLRQAMLVRRAERPAHQPLRAFPDETPDDFVLPSSEAQRFEHRVHRVGEIAPRVHQRAVQIVHDGLQAHVRSWTAGGRLTRRAPAVSDAGARRIPSWRTEVMKKILFLAAVVVMAAACGGPAQDVFAKATPSFDAAALDISAGDAVPENFEASASGGQSPSAALDAAQAAVDDACHPHLFVRTHAVVAATNGSIWRVLRTIRRIIPFSPRRRDGGTHVWERVVDGLDYKYSIVKTGDHSFNATLEVKKVDPTSSFVTVYEARVERDPSNHDGSGTATL